MDYIQTVEKSLDTLQTFVVHGESLRLVPVPVLKMKCTNLALRDNVLYSLPRKGLNTKKSKLKLKV